jgi:hypothetical protein
VVWKKRLTDMFATTSPRRAGSGHESAGTSSRVRTARVTLVATRIERRLNLSMNGPVKGPTSEKGRRVTASTFVTCPGVLETETSKIRTAARAIW